MCSSDLASLRDLGRARQSVLHHARDRGDRRAARDRVVEHRRDAVHVGPWSLFERLVLCVLLDRRIAGLEDDRERLRAALVASIRHKAFADARALGETAPLIVAGAVLGSFSGTNLAKMVTGNYTALPVVIYDWSRRPQEAFRADAAAGIVVLLVAVLAVNAAAIVLRARFERDR